MPAAVGRHPSIALSNEENLTLRKKDHLFSSPKNRLT